MKVTLVVAVILLGTACALKCYDGCITPKKLVAEGKKQEIPEAKQVCAKSTVKGCTIDEACGNMVIKVELGKNSAEGNYKFCVGKDVKEKLTETECADYANRTDAVIDGSKITCGKLLKCEEELCNTGHKMTAAGALLLIAMIAQLLM